jgi:hypothetical protein
MVEVGYYDWLELPAQNTTYRKPLKKRDTVDFELGGDGGESDYS